MVVLLKLILRAEVIKKGIIKVGDNFACSSEIISQAKGKEDQDFNSEYYFGYGFCTKDGWQKVKNKGKWSIIIKIYFILWMIYRVQPRS